MPKYRLVIGRTKRQTKLIHSCAMHFVVVIVLQPKKGKKKCRLKAVVPTDDKYAVEDDGSAALGALSSALLAPLGHIACIVAAEHN